MREFWEDHEFGCILTTIILCACLIPGIVCWHFSRYTVEVEPMVVEVQDKYQDSYTTYIHSGKVLVPQKHKRYYLVWGENKIRVSKEVYDNSEIGDKFVVKVIVRRSKETGIIHDVDYEYGKD